MKGDPKVIKALNDALREELTAINQYFVHAEMCENWGYKKLADYIKKQSIDEMKHAEVLIERVLFLDGTPTMEPLKLTVGATVRNMIESDLALELKVKGLERITLDLFLRCKPRRGFVVSSFTPGVLKSLRAEDSTVPLGLICEFENQLRLWSEVPVQYVIPEQKLVEPELIRKIKGAGKKIIVWTVNDADTMLRFQDLGVDGIISDDTELLKRTCRP